MPLFITEAEYEKIKKQRVAIPHETMTAMTSYLNSTPKTDPGWKRIKRLVDPTYNPQRKKKDSGEGARKLSQNKYPAITGGEAKSSLNHIKRDCIDYGDFGGQINGFLERAVKLSRSRVKPLSFVPKTSRAKAAKPSEVKDIETGSLKVTPAAKAN